MSNRKPVVCYLAEALRSGRKIRRHRSVAFCDEKFFDPSSHGFDAYEIMQQLWEIDPEPLEPRQYALVNVDGMIVSFCDDLAQAEQLRNFSPEVEPYRIYKITEVKPS